MEIKYPVCDFKISIILHKDNVSALVDCNVIKFYSVKPSERHNNVIITFNFNTSFLGSALVQLLEDKDIPCTLVSIKSV